MTGNAAPLPRRGDPPQSTLHKESSNPAPPSSFNADQISAIPNDPVTNPWLAVGQKKSSKRSTSDTRIDKLQNKKRKKDESEREDARVHIDVSLENINQTLTALRKDEQDNEDTPTMTYGRGMIAFRQQELINRAFAADGFEEEFAAEKAAAIAEDAPKEEDLTLPGWGAWTGQGVKRRATERKLVRKIPGVEESKRKDAKLKDVIINEKRVKNVLSSVVLLTQEYQVSGECCAISVPDKGAVRKINKCTCGTGMDNTGDVSKDDETQGHHKSRRCSQPTTCTIQIV